MWCWLLFPSRTGWEYVFFTIVVCVSFPGASLLIVGCGFLTDCGLWSHPCLVDCVSLYRVVSVVGYCGVILAMIGPRTTQGSISPVPAMNSLFCCGYAVVGLWTVWSGIEGWVCLRNLVFGSYTNIVRCLASFSPK